MLRCVIVDDEPIARRGMRRLAEMRDELHVVGSASNVKEAERIIAAETEPVDLLFLDIDMEGESGMDYARRLGKGPKVIFTTAYADYAIDSYEVEAFDFLLKPIRRERFNRAIDRMLSVPQAGEATRGQYITVKADRRIVRIPVDKIEYIEGFGDYLVIHFDGRRLTTRLTFKAMEEMLEDTAVRRVNKSYMVNTDKILSYDSSSIMINEKEIPIGTTYRDQVLQFLSNPQ